MDATKLFAILMQIATAEAPTLKDDGGGAGTKFIDGINTMAAHYVAVGAAGSLISPEVDPLLLAAVGFEESRHQPDVRDGDCFMKGGCRVVGPMQLHKGTPLVLGNIDPTWKGVTVKQMRDPRKNVEGAYRMLRFFKSECANTTPDIWLGAYSMGHCTKQPIRLGTRRCAIAKAMAKRAGTDFVGCEAKPKDRLSGRIITALTKKD